jgi:hypothetical protein
MFTLLLYTFVVLSLCFECLLNELFVVNFVFGDPFTLTRRNWVLLVLYCSAGIQQLNRDQPRNRCGYFTINLLIYHPGALQQNVQGHRIYSIVTDIMCRRLYGSTRGHYDPKNTGFYFQITGIPELSILLSNCLTAVIFNLLFLALRQALVSTRQAVSM